MQDKVTQKRPETGRFLRYSNVISLSPCCGGEHYKQGEYLKAAGNLDLAHAVDARKQYAGLELNIHERLAKMLCRLGHVKLECLCTSVIDEYGQTTAPANDYVCYFSVEFGK